MLKNSKKLIAFIPSAGFGTRLMPLTRQKPKALVSFMGDPMLGRTIDKLSNLGIKRFIVNVHHYPEQIKAYLDTLDDKLDIRVSDETEELLDTGGGLYKASKLLHDDEDVLLVHNVDLHTEFDLQKMIETHFENDNDITLAVSDRRSNRKLMFKDNELCGWKNTKTSELIKRFNCDTDVSLAFSGIHLVNKKVIKARQKDDAFPLIPWYLDMDAGVKIASWKHNPNEWFDLGTISRIEQAEKAIRNKQ